MQDIARLLQLNLNQIVLTLEDTHDEESSATLSLQKGSAGLLHHSSLECHAPPWNACLRSSRRSQAKPPGSLPLYRLNERALHQVAFANPSCSLRESVPGPLSVFTRRIVDYSCHSRVMPFLGNRGIVDRSIVVSLNCSEGVQERSVDSPINEALIGLLQEPEREVVINIVNKSKVVSKQRFKFKATVS